MTQDPTHVWVLIPAHRPALGHVKEALSVLGEVAAHAVVVANGQHPITEYETGTHVVHDRTPDINISRWWNLGLDQIQEWETNRHGEVHPHHVLIMNADTRIGLAGIALLSHALDKHPDARMAGPMRAHGVHVETRAEPLGLEQRIPGYCFMVTSRNPMRADERFRWWCGDDDLEWRSRAEGGTLLVGRIEFRHLGDGQPKGPLLDLAKEDVVRFEEKWGIRPW